MLLKNNFKFLLILVFFSCLEIAAVKTSVPDAPKPPMKGRHRSTQQRRSRQLVHETNSLKKLALVSSFADRDARDAESALFKHHYLNDNKSTCCYCGHHLLKWSMVNIFGHVLKDSKKPQLLALFPKLGEFAKNYATEYPLLERDRKAASIASTKRHEKRNSNKTAE